LRIIAGTHKRREIKAPKGIKTRPTSDRVKEGIFNTLREKIEGAVILDLFSGSGNLALESISRGSNFAYLVENDKNAYYTIMENVKKLDMSAKISSYNMSWGKFLDIAEKENIKFDLIFLDPPYYGKYYSEVIKKISSLDILNNNGVLIIETPEKMDLKELENEVFESVKESKYGDTKVFYFQKKRGIDYGNN
jgi:16S rRNA (guanine(966)-N(2))-methyltransferase RsmD